MTSAATSEDAFQDRMLQGVSRTFALTIPQLPVPLQPAIGNAYLLCRLADTIEDASGLDASGKAAAFGLLEASLAAPDRATDLAAALAPEVDEADPAERELVHEAERVVGRFHALPAAQQAPLRRCVTIMARGMTRFEGLKSPVGLPDCAAFRDYCYYVAGVVGEMLTELFACHDPAIAAQRDRLRQQAVAFGQGLQMTNILKDIWDDRARGVCWLPRDLFERHGITLEPGGDWHRHAGFRTAITELAGVAHGHLRVAHAYTRGIPREQRGIRRFCAWAIGMALYTLRNIAADPGFRDSAAVKISRPRVRAVVLGGNLAVAHDRLLDCAFAWAARGLPAPGDRHPALNALSEETPWTQRP